MATKRERCYSTQTEGRTVEVAGFYRVLQCERARQ